MEIVQIIDRRSSYYLYCHIEINLVAIDTRKSLISLFIKGVRLLYCLTIFRKRGIVGFFVHKLTNIR